MNTIRTPRQGTNETSRRIARAVDNEEWQKFRISLKGKSTREKMYRLFMYHHDTNDEDINIRVDNYIKALCRGGLLYPGCSLFEMNDCGWEYEGWIKR